MQKAKQEIYEGENNPNWQGGTSFEPYTSDWTKELREKVRDRDNHTCQLCHKTEKELNETLNVHHIDYDKEHSVMENLISLCQKCHSRTNGNRKFWTNYFTNLLLQLI
jgi:5-methylcytosine-specific restriction endonuclease McrA